MMKTLERNLSSGVICSSLRFPRAGISRAETPENLLTWRHKLHINCTGKGTPTVVIENGLGDFSLTGFWCKGDFQFLCVCTYDRAGYAWSDAGIELVRAWC